MRRKLLIVLAASAFVTAASYPAGTEERGEISGDRSYYTEPRSMGGQSGSPAAEPQRWVRVGYDYNDDGIIDRYEYLSVQDLESVRRRGMERQGSATVPGREFYTGRAAAGEPSRDTMQIQTLTGSVMDTREISLAGMDQRHLIAKIETPEGRIARVDLGPVGSLSGLGIRHGERVTVHGTTGTINDKAMLMAHRVEVGDRVVTVGWPNDRSLSRYSGEVLNIKMAGFGDPNVPEQAFARVLLDQGGVTAVNLGPSHSLRNMATGDLRGKHISFLAHPAKIGDRVALVAEELRVDGRTVHVDWSSAAPRG